jgi:phage shock protein A
MENDRDSSIWRSLAVAFGDGLAFGVGMKLTQNAARQPGAPHTGAPALADRFESLEQRMERLERTPIAAPEAAPGPGSVGFAPKVIEAVVQAVDERLSDQAKQVERRVAGLEGRIAEVRSQFDAEMAAVHDHVEGGMQGFAESERRLGQLEARIAEVRSQFDAELAAVHDRVEGGMRGFAESEEQLREEIRRVADSSSNFDAAAAEAVIETKLVPLRVEITEMRQRLAESDRAVLDLILAIGQMCRQAAERITDAAPPPPESAPPPSHTEPPLNGTGDSLRAAPEEPGVPMDPSFESPAPDFTQLKKATSLWRVPLVSSLLVTTGSLLLLHYL